MGRLSANWIQASNTLQAAANLNEETLPGYRNPEDFIVVSETCPTVSADAALRQGTATHTDARAFLPRGAVADCRRRPQREREHARTGFPAR